MTSNIAEEWESMSPSKRKCKEKLQIRMQWDGKENSRSNYCKPGCVSRNGCERGLQGDEELQKELTLCESVDLILF